jgi:GTP cyclohydrolase IA
MALATNGARRPAHTRQKILTTPVDTERIKRAVREIIAAIGEDADRDGLIETPRRIAAMYEEIFAGLRTDPYQFLNVTFDEAYSEMVVLKDIPFYSMCEHHFAPFHGVAHVAYIPSGRVVGLSKLARVVEAYARRPQVQERLTAQIADTIMEGLQPQGVGVVIQAEHTCLTMRGIKKPGAKMVTSAVRGLFKDHPPTRAEFQAILRGDHFGGMGGAS